MARRKKIVDRFLFFLVAVITLIHISPLVVVLINSLRTNDAIAARLLGFPDRPHFENYPQVWKIGSYLNSYLVTILIGMCAAVVVMALTGLAAYGLVKVNSYFKKFFEGYFVVALSIPYFAMMVPIFFVFYNLGLVNTLAGIIILHVATNIPFSFMFVYAFFKGLPKELDEAARIDGCSELQNFWYNALPLAKPILTSVILIVFVNCWNEFLFSNLFLQSDAVRTVALKFYNFTGQYSSEYAYMYAAAIISVAPIVIIYLMMQNTFIEGLTAGSVKG